MDKQEAAAIMSDLTRVKAEFQKRTITAIMTEPPHGKSEPFKIQTVRPKRQAEGVKK